MKIGTKLKEKRTEYNLTQEQLAEEIFVSRKTLSNWELGKSTPDIDSLIRLAYIFYKNMPNIVKIPVGDIAYRKLNRNGSILSVVNNGVNSKKDVSQNELRNA